MAKLSTIAEVEFERLKGAAEWCPLTTPVQEMNSARSTRYTFQDGSRLYVYANGAATCERHAADVIAYREQWHSLAG